ncbi:MAG: sugar ABC transporter permease [Caldilinea sp.]|nr:sugar ABC transporter permease [Caldilinea sp.]MCB0151013.1 sugar ABC transporter permease [Caldilineaceae bacterium]MCB0050612.1 sugar ABC transporter permease [Caldilinea sp.]MCB9113960.1 sugar ABC transporter permease [Caldilineaceae bacterium]MCB9118551.1 sugar ABC transporter permease [Caldilineaceae bacterium]
MRSNRMGWTLLSPTLIILALVGFLPFFYVLFVSLFDWNPFSNQLGMQWAGVNNFRRLVFDGAFLDSLWRTGLFAFTSVAIELSLGFLLAQTLVKSFPGRTIFRTIYVLPLVMAPIAVGATWRLLTIPGFGPIPYFLDKWFDFDYRLGTFAEQAFLTVILMDVWHWTPFVTLTLLAGLTAMPKEPLEQAQVDGANRWQVFRYLTIPMMMPVLLTVIFIRLMDALRIVDEVFMLTSGGPGTATQFIGIHIYRVVVPKTDYGYGSAMSLLVLYFTIVLCWLLFIALAQVGKQRE